MTKNIPQMIAIDHGFLCGNDHLTDDPRQCPCGSKNLISLWGILNRDTTDREAEYVGLLCELPAFREWEN